MNAQDLNFAAAMLDTAAVESTKRASRQLRPDEKPEPFYLADCMRAIAAALGDRVLTQELFDKVFPSLPNVFSDRLGDYGPKDRAASYRAAVEWCAANTEADNPLI